MNTSLLRQQLEQQAKLISRADEDLLKLLKDGANEKNFSKAK